MIGADHCLQQINFHQEPTFHVITNYTQFMSCYSKGRAEVLDGFHVLLLTRLQSRE